MPDDPDFVAQVRFAADVVEKVSRMYGAFIPDEYPLTAAWLRHEANQMEVPF